MWVMAGEIDELGFGFHPMLMIIKEGHRIRIAIARHDKGTFARIPAEGTPDIMVSRNKLHTSYVDIPIVQGEMDK